jgi:hypothetical protein
MQDGRARIVIGRMGCVRELSCKEQAINASLLGQERTTP